MSSEPFVAAVAAAMAGGDRSAALALLYRCPRVRSILSTVGRQHSLTEADVEDVRQRVALLFFTKLIDVLREPEGAYPVIFASAKRYALKVASKMREASIDAMAAHASIDSVDDFLEVLAEPGTGSERKVEDAVIEDVTKARLKETFAARMAQFGSKGVLQVVPDAEPPQQGKRRRKRAGYSAAQLRLRQIRSDLQLTLPEYSKALDVSEIRLHAMLYGLASRVPADTLRAAEDLHANQIQERQRETHRYNNTPMRQIVIEWMKALAILDASATEPEDGDLARLASVLSVNRSTCWRWLVENNKPRLSTLNRYDALVTKLCASKSQIKVDGPRTSKHALLRTSAVRRNPAPP